MTLQDDRLIPVSGNLCRLLFSLLFYNMCVQNTIFFNSLKQFHFDQPKLKRRRSFKSSSLFFFCSYVPPVTWKSFASNLFGGTRKQHSRNSCSAWLQDPPKSCHKSRNERVCGVQMSTCWCHLSGGAAQCNEPRFKDPHFRAVELGSPGTSGRGCLQ